MNSKQRKRELLSAALALSVRHGYNHVTRAQIATAAGCSEGLVTHSLGTMTTLRRAIMGEAIRAECLPVIAQGLAARDARAMRIPDDVKRRAAATLHGG